MENNTIIGVFVVFGMTFIGFLLNIYKQGKEQAEAQYKLNSEINITINKLNLSIEKLHSIIEYLSKDIERLQDRATVHGKELDSVNLTINTLSTVQHQLVDRVTILENKRCIGLQNLHNISEN